DRPVDAIAHFQDGLLLWPNNSVARYMLGQADEGIGDLDGAISEYRYALRADPKNFDARLRLIGLYEAEGADDLALAIALQGGDPEDAGRVRFVALRISARLGRPETRALLSQAGRRPARRAAALAAVAEGARDRVGPEGAIRLLRSATRVDLTDPRTAAALRALVGYLVEAGRAEEAEREAARALAKHPDAAAFPH